MPSSPTVSVIMPVYNAGSYLRDAIDSILQQTYTDFELIIVNDGSTDGSEKKIKEFTDHRVRLYSQENQGLTNTLNRLVSLSQGKYIARMDQDDWSFPDRLARQAKFLDNHPEVGLLGSWVEVVNPSNAHVGVNRFPVSDPAIKEMLLVKNTFAHGAIMMRRDSAVQYQHEYDYAEDFGLWCQLAKGKKLANLPIVLYRWRTSPGGMSARFAKTQNEARRRILRGYRQFYTREYSRPQTNESDLAEVAYRGKLRALLGKVKIALVLIRLGRVDLFIQKVAESFRILTLGVQRSTFVALAPRYEQ